MHAHRGRSCRLVVGCGALLLVSAVLATGWRVRVHGQVREAVRVVGELGGLMTIETTISSEVLPYVPRGLAQLYSAPASVAFNDRRADDQTLRALCRLPGLRRLRVLYLNGTGISDAGLARLTALADLEELYLEDTAIGDRGLQSLAGLGSLRILSVRNTMATPAGAARLQAALPNLELVGWMNMRRQSM